MTRVIDIHAPCTPEACLRFLADHGHRFGAVGRNDRVPGREAAQRAAILGANAARLLRID